MSNQVAQSLMSQIGRPTFFMLGAQSLVDLGNGLQFSIKGSPRQVTKLVITLDPSDTYTVQAWKIRGRVCKMLAEQGNVYADSLHSTIETMTALRTSL